MFSDTPLPPRLPPRLAAAVHHLRSARPHLSPPPPPSPEDPPWQVSPDGLWVVDGVGRTFAVLHTGRLVEPGPGVPPPQPDAHWRPACVLMYPKHRRHWTAAERVEYEAASPQERQAARPRAPHLLAAQEEVVVHPAACTVAGVRLDNYTVREVRRALTATNAEVPAVPLRPAAWPPPAPEAGDSGGPGGAGSGPGAGSAQLSDGGGSTGDGGSQEGLSPAPAAGQGAGGDADGGAPASSGGGTALGGAAAAAAAGRGVGSGAGARGPVGATLLAQREAAWQREAQERHLRPSRAQHFNNHPVALDPWLHRTSAAATQQQGASARVSARYRSSPSSTPPGARRSSRLQAAAEVGAGPSAPSSVGGPGGAGGAVATAGGGGAPPGAPATPPRPLPPDASALRAAWRRLWGCPAGRPAKVLLWRVQHASLACGLYRAAKGLEPPVARGQLPRGAQCQLPCCLDAEPPPWAHLTHVFCECPTYEAARSWLRDLWGALAPAAAPPPVANTALMLGDCSSAWASYPSGRLADLWTALRATFLHALWAAYWSREPEQQTSEAVVREVVAELQRLIRLRFVAAALPPAALDALPTAFLTAQLKPAKLADFSAVWATGGVLCVVHEAEGAAPRLEVRLSLQHPVAAPGP